MVFSIQDIVQECVDKVADMRSGGAQEKIPVLWDGFTRLIHQNVQGGRGVNVPKFGKFTVMKTTGKKVFIPADAFIRAHGINAKRPPNTLLANCVDIVYSKIAARTKLSSRS